MTHALSFVPVLFLTAASVFGVRQEEPPALKEGEVALEFIAHACFRVHGPGGETILLDPFASRVWLGYDFPEGLRADAVVITHPHYDHDAGRFVGKPFPFDESIPVFDGPGSSQVGHVEIVGVAGKHADPYGKEFGQKNTLFVVEAEGLRIAHLGDNGPLTPQNIEDLGRVDVLLVPVDGHEHILKNEDVEAAIDALDPRVVVPMHYRHPELEEKDESPKDLGTIDPWLEGRKNVTRTDTNIRVLSKEGLAEEREVWVPAPSPMVARVGG